jgi:hypothetical protein
VADDPIILTPVEIERIARTAASQAVRETFLTIGIDVSGPDGVLEAQRDWAHLRKWKKTVEKTEVITIRAILTTLIGGGLALLWIGFGEAIKKLFGVH